MNKKRSFFLTKRGIAYLLDLLIINLIIIVPFGSVLKDYEIGLFSFSFSQDLILSISIIIILVLMLAYFSVLEYKVQQTIGKMIMGIYVKSKNLTFKNALIRNITKPFLFLLILDSLFLFGKGKKRFTEKISNTEVKEL